MSVLGKYRVFALFSFASLASSYRIKNKYEITQDFQFQFQVLEISLNTKSIWKTEPVVSSFRRNLLLPDQALRSKWDHPPLYEALCDCCYLSDFFF